MKGAVSNFGALSEAYDAGRRAHSPESVDFAVSLIPENKREEALRELRGYIEDGLVDGFYQRAKEVEVISGILNNFN